MARPQKSNADYYPMDVNFLGDKKIKLLKSEFGLNCIVVIIAMFENIYGRDGYFLKWDDDECLLMSDGVGGGCTPNYIREVLKGCIRRSLFDEGVFNMFGVITSKGIQRRYLKIFERRDEITIYEEYLLLDLNSRDDVPLSVVNKLAIKSFTTNNSNATKSEKTDKCNNNLDKCNGNPDKCNGNPDKCDNNSTKKSKVKESKGESDADASAHAESSDKSVRHKHGAYGWVLLTDEEYSRLVKDYGEEKADYHISYVDEQAQSTGNKNKWKDWNLTVRKAIRDGWGKYISAENPNKSPTEQGRTVW